MIQKKRSCLQLKHTTPLEFTARRFSFTVKQNRTCERRQNAPGNPLFPRGGVFACCPMSQAREVDLGRRTKQRAGSRTCALTTFSRQTKPQGETQKFVKASCQVRAASQALARERRWRNKVRDANVRGFEKEQQQTNIAWPLTNRHESPPSLPL